MAEAVVGLMGLGRIGRNLVRILYDRDDVRWWRSPTPRTRRARVPAALRHHPRPLPRRRSASRTGTSTSPAGRSRCSRPRSPGEVPLGRARRRRGGRGDRPRPLARGARARTWQPGAKRVILLRAAARPARHHRGHGRQRRPAAPGAPHRLQRLVDGARRGAGRCGSSTKPSASSGRSSPPSTPTPASSASPTCRPRTCAAAAPPPRTSSRRTTNARRDARSSCCPSSPAGCPRHGDERAGARTARSWTWSAGTSSRSPPEAVNEVVRTAAGEPRWKDILDYEDEPIVSARHRPLALLRRPSTRWPP